jgi:hypothetical protein
MEKNAVIFLGYICERKIVCIYFLDEKRGRKSRQTHSPLYCIRPIFVVKQLRADGKEYSSNLGAWERR